MKIRTWIKNFLCLVLSLMIFTVYATETSNTNSTTPSADSGTSVPQTIVPSPPNIDAKGYILMDANTGYLMAGKNIDTRMPPASLTKLMTLYQIATALKANRLHLSDPVAISEKAWRTGGSKMFVKVGDQVPVSALIQGIAVVSGNDACVAMAEHLAGTEDSFADLMNHSAKLLGMKNTHYTDATGLPDSNHYTSPRDLALLTQAIIKQFPEYYGWYSQKEFTYNRIKQPNRDLLLWRDSSIEGMKTGHTEEAGYCLVSTASRNGMRLISVVMGSSSSRSRANASLALLNYGFRFYESKKVLTANAAIKQPRIWFGVKKELPVGVNQDLYITAPTGKLSHVQVALTLDNGLKAPIRKGQVVGNILLKLNNKDYSTQPVVALEDDPKSGFFSQAKDHVALFFTKMFDHSQTTNVTLQS